MRALSGPFALVIALSGCTRIEDMIAKVPFLGFMRDAPFFDPYEAPRPAPAHAVPFESPVGEVLPPLEATEATLNAFAAGPFGQNPFAGEDLSVLGQQMYDRHCMVCHGVQGRGDGPIVQKDPAEQKYPPLAPNLTLPTTVNRPDGYLYGLIRVGRGLMPAYGPRTTHRERWAIVTWIRQLQAGAGTQPGGN